MFNIAALLDPSVYPHTVTQCELIETHISWVILTGAYAYKIKKPVNYGFLDFSTLEKRHKYCQEELRLNRRLAGNIYIEVVAITGTFEQPEVTEHLINGNNVIEYAVKMQQFPQQDQLDRMLAADKLLPGHIDAFADRIAEFHQQIDIADMSTIYGNVEQVCVPLQENLAQIRNSVRDSEHRSVLVELEQWGNSEFKTLKNVFLQRKQAGFVRECHGDMHLRNLAWIENKPVLFDCIEFNAELRWIDVISDIAFLVMDLQDRDQPQLAQRFLNRYLEITGDYEGVAVLPYYLFYRALVRAKVDAIRASQSGISQKEKSDAERDMAGYLKLAQSYTRNNKPKLILTRGLSGSGKTTITQLILEKTGAIRIRSDVERKRIFGVKINQKDNAGIGEGIYSQRATENTYSVLLNLAESILDAGFAVIVDATFINPSYVRPFEMLANEKKTGILIIEFMASMDTLRQRIINRKHEASDADLAVLENQINHWINLDDNNIDKLIKVDTEKDIDITALVEVINKKR